MFRLFLLYAFRRPFYVLLSALSIVLLFSSWGSAVYHTTLKDLAGNTAFTPAVTKHQLIVKGKAIAYQANAGYLTINDKDEQPLAHIFYTAYNLNNNERNRPVTFVFNGGPGSASIWLHMGSFGPVRVTPNKPGYAENKDTWLPFTDLVFIDPVGTGYSRAADGINVQKFYNYKEDISSIAAFIKQYLKQNNRGASPKFIVGESYGAARAVGLTAFLQDSLNIKLTGLIFISPALNYKLITFRKDNNSPYPYYLTTYALAAQYHHQLAPELEQLTPEQLQARVARFAQGSYSRFIALGRAARAVVEDRIIDSVSYFTGISKAELQKNGGRVSDIEFTRTLLRDSNKIAGTFDSRVSGPLAGPEPSEARLRAVFPQAFGDYVQHELNYQNNLPYQVTTNISDWNYGPEAVNGYLDVSATLEKLIQANPELKVNVACGYYDLATPVQTTQYVVDHLNLKGPLKNNITVKYYRSGHMVYTDNNANKAFRTETERFYEKVLKTSLYL